MTLT
jgi:hypothetical protein